MHTGDLIRSRNQYAEVCHEVDNASTGQNGGTGMNVPALLHNEFEQSGEDVRELHQRLKAARTRAELHAIATAAEQRRLQQGLPWCVETAYHILSTLACRRMHQLEDTHND